MTKDPTRNHRIAHAVIAGAPMEAIAKQNGLSVVSVREIIRRMKPLLETQRGRPIAAGMSLQAAITIEQAIGMWPGLENAEEIAKRRIDILRAPGGSVKLLEELDAWLRSQPDGPKAKIRSHDSA
jgi:hypothetical protein